MFITLYSWILLSFLEAQIAFQNASLINQWREGVQESAIDHKTEDSATRLELPFSGHTMLDP